MSTRLPIGLSSLLLSSSVSEDFRLCAGLFLFDMFLRFPVVAPGTRALSGTSSSESDSFPAIATRARVERGKSSSPSDMILSFTVFQGARIRHRSCSSPHKLMRSDSGTHTEVQNYGKNLLRAQGMCRPTVLPHLFVSRDSLCF